MLSTKSMHVVVIGKYYPPEFGGIEKYTADVVRSLSRKYKVTALVHNKESPHDSVEQDGDVTIIRCGTMGIVKAQPISPSMWTHLRRLQPDLIYFNAPNFWASAALAFMHRDCPLIITHHADVFGRRLLRWLVMPFYRSLVRRSRHVVVNSIKNARISPDLPQDIGSLVEVPWGVDDRFYSPPDRDDAFRARREKRFGDAFVVGFVGRFVRYKGLQVLLRALSEVEGVHALLVGDGPLRPLVEAQIEELGLGDRVHLMGNVSDESKIEEMSYMDALAFPSTETTEAFGASQVEAQLLKIPVIASDLPTGVTDVTDNTTGILVPVEDHSALAAALKTLRDDPELAARLGEAGRRRALARFTIRAFEKRIADLVDSCFEERAAALLQEEQRRLA